MNTTNPFTEAARAEAERRWPRAQTDGRPLSAHARMNRRIGFEIGALWAAAQEPTDAEVEAAATAGLDAVSPTWRATMSRPAEDDLEFTRAALIRARAARRDEEKR
ncbi:hypothetical protein ACIGH6_14330 [Brachybacterium paraconglomeratum]|uniref:hypothetical protein n=1 Tax=Brachybacterium paraconglomeratum TaxID=173362 RepID=UPI0037C5F71F